MDAEPVKQPRDRYGRMMKKPKVAHTGDVPNWHAARLFGDTLRRAIAQDNGKRLRKAAEALLDSAADGEAWAIGMLADRLDGKVLPMLPDTGDGTLVISWVQQAAQPTTVDITPAPESIEHAAPSKDDAGVP